MIKTKQPGKHYSLKLIFITLLLTINCQKPTAIEFLNQTRNALNDLSSTSVNIFNLSNEWLNKILNPQNIITSYSLFNLPLVKSENIADEDISKDEDVELLIQSQCLEQNRIFLSEQDQRVNFDMILSRPPSSNINITFVNDKPDLFEIQPEYIFYKNAYYSTTSNNSTVTLLEKNYNLTTHFTVKTLKDHGKSKLKFIIDTELNIVKDDNTILQVNKKGNNGRLLLDKSLSNYLDLRATSSNIGALNIFLILWIVLFMFSLGLSFSGNTLKGLYKWKRLKPFICGYVCQLIINPLVAFILTKIFKLSDYISLGVIIVAASPGSFIAPVFTYYLGGDRALAVGLCLVATILGSFTFPLAIWLFCFVLSIKIETYIPFWETFSLTATQIVPLGIGCLILHFKPNWASKLKKGAPIWAFAIILTSLITSLKNYGQIFVNRWEAYSMPIILGIISYTIGFVFPRTLGLNNQEVRAICFNTGLQNSPLAIAVIQVLGTPSCSNLISLVPLHHSLWTVLEGVIVGVTMFFIFPNTVKPIIENSEYPMNAGRSEEENKAILQDDGSDNYSNNTSLLDTVNVLDISDINIRQHYLPKNNINNNNNNNNNNNLSSSEMTMISNNHNQNIISPPSPTPTSYSAKIFRGGSVNSRSSHSTITPKYTSLNRINKQRSHSDAPMPKKTNKNTNTDTNTNENTNTNSFSNSNSNSNSNSFSNSNSNNLTPTLNATSIYQQRKNSSASTIKFNINNPNYLKSHSSLNKNNFDLGIEIIDISDMSDDDDDEDDGNTSVNGVVNPTFNHHYQDNNKSPNITNHNNKDSTTTNNNHQQQIPIIYVHNTNNQSSSPIIAYSPQQNSNTHSNNESSRSISVVSNNPNHTPTKSETNSTSSKEGTIKTNKYYNNNTNHTDDLIEFSIDTSTETNSSSNDKSELSNSYHHGKGKEDLEDYHHNHNRSNSQSGGSNSDTNSKNKITDRIRQHNKKKLSHPQINFSQMMKQYLPLVFKKPTNNDVATSNTSSTSTSSNQINSNDNISPKDNNNNINNDNVNNDISNNNINNNDNTNSIVNNSVEKMNDHRNSHSNEGENNNTTSSIHSLNLNQRDNNKNYPNLNNSNNNSSMSMNNSNSNMHRISINNDFINESSTTNSDYKNQETEFHSINSANNSSILNSINKDNKNKDINVNLYPFDNSQIKHLDPMDSIEYITLSNNDLTNYSHYSNSIKSLRRKKHAVQRTDTIQTYETACSSMFKSISSENENFKHVKDGDDDDDDIEEYDEVDEEEDDDDDEIFKDCTFEFQNTKGKNEFEFF